MPSHNTTGSEQHAAIQPRGGSRCRTDAAAVTAVAKLVPTGTPATTTGQDCSSGPERCRGPEASLLTARDKEMRKASARHLDATRRPSRDTAVPSALRAVMTDACGGDRDGGVPVAVLHGCIATLHAPS